MKEFFEIKIKDVSAGDEVIDLISKALEKGNKIVIEEFSMNYDSCGDDFLSFEELQSKETKKIAYNLSLKAKLEQFEETKESPIYTKEMHERGELPPVGSEVALRVSKHAVTTYETKSMSGKKLRVVAHDGDLAVAIHEESSFAIRVNYMWLNPLPSPVDELAAEIMHYFEGCEFNKLTSGNLAKLIINGGIDISKYINLSRESDPK